MQIWLNGTIDQVGEKTPFEAGSLLGWGVFTTLGIWSGRPFATGLHLERLRRDAARTDVPIEWPDEALRKALIEVIAVNGIENGLARITATRRGDGRWVAEEGGSLSVCAIPLVRQETVGVKLLLSNYRIEARRPLAGIKTTSCLDHYLAGRAATSAGFDDALLCNGAGALCECSRSNVFLSRDGTLFTPSLESGPLAGIARALVLRWAEETGVPDRQGAFIPHELQTADEFFITSSASGPRPVASLQLDEGSVIGWKTPGELTAQFTARWQRAVSENEFSGV